MLLPSLCRHLAQGTLAVLECLRSVPNPLGAALPHPAHTGKEYLVDGKLTGKDMAETRAPQRYGITDLEDVLN